MRVLVVDDSSMVRDVLCAMLERLGHETTIAVDAASALAADACDFVLLDQQLPDRPGSEIVPELRVNHGSAPIYGISGHPQAHQQARDADMDGCLRKPFKLRDVRAVLGMAKAHRDLGGRDLVRTMLEGVVDEVPRLMREASASDDPKELHRLAHTIGGCLRFLDAPAARQAAAAVERASKEGRRDDAALRLLDDEIGALVPQLRQLLG